MKKALKKALNLKNGNSFPVGHEFEISVPQDKPTIALLKNGFQEIKIHSSALWKYFSGFEKATVKMLMGEGDFDSCICPSLTGEMVEPDGWDSKGFPSLLLSLGYI